MAVEYLCIGHASYDLSVFLDGFPAENAKYETRELRQAGGGPAANAAFLLSLWGESAAFAGCIGDDPHGAAIRGEFLEVGTDVSLLETRTGHVTPVSVILVNRRNGTRTIVNRKLPSQPLRLDPSRLPTMKPRVLLLDGHELEASLTAMEHFPEAISILDAGSLREGTKSLASRVGYVVASDRFAAQITGTSPAENPPFREECVETLRRRFPGPAVAVTLGEHGVIADDGSGFVHLPACTVSVVDTTAAGDIFHGALAYALGHGMSFRTALRFSTFTASLSVARPGGRLSIPSLREVEEGFRDAE
jgi:sulfofructose kinase